jgi:hypothetical protein
METRSNLRLVITVLIHVGTITVSSEEACYARFQIQLPIVPQAEHQYV